MIKSPGENPDFLIFLKQSFVQRFNDLLPVLILNPIASKVIDDISYSMAIGRCCIHYGL